ncbi:MAG TPA: hypothetical protein VKA09_02605 [Nitrososphaeraceae archaeon]|nr:hypothetical protein [Nitrososphaeraceae archaeon]
MITVFAVVGMLLLFNLEPAFSVSMAVFSHGKDTFLSSSDLEVTELDSKLGSKIKGGTYIQVTADTISDIFTRPFEHQVEIDANQIFPNETLKREIISKSGSFEFTIPNLNYSLLGFNISAYDVKVNANAKQVMDDSGGQSNKTRIDFPVMLARSVNVSNEMISQKYENVDLSSIYAFYDPETDKFTFHVPYEIAARYLLNGS